MKKFRKEWAHALIVTGVFLLLATLAPAHSAVAQTEAPTGFDNLTNGNITQAEFDAALDVFAEREENDDGLGPVYNADSCQSCHANPVTGGNSQITELRVARLDGNLYSDPPGGNLINSRSIDAAIKEVVFGADNLQTFRVSPSILGLGYVESVGNSTLQAIQASQPGALRGTLIAVPVFEANNALRIGRFGHKDQQASLESFAADAYLNEMGITSPLQPTENTSNGNSVAAFDEVADPEDADGEDVEIFADFMRATKAPAPDAAVANDFDVRQGGVIFRAIGCDICHISSITTSPPGTVINGGALQVSNALGNKIIHPYSDYALHDVGTGDFIIQNGGVGTFAQVRTAPLWGLRTKDRLMHDGENFTRNNSILRHAGQATPVINNYRVLSVNQKNQLIAFINSL